jgi:pimeloyl-ACP methyl ester carboxylesterase
MTQAAQTAERVVRINGINIAFRLQGDGPPLVLIMGYRLSSVAWPVKLVEALAKNFTVITFDNRGTGQSDKPLNGYALANMARDVAGLLDEIGIESTYVLGYSMGGAIAQEFTRQFAHRVAGLILCATMCGGPCATFCGKTFGTTSSLNRTGCSIAGRPTSYHSRANTFAPLQKT